VKSINCEINVTSRAIVLEEPTLKVGQPKRRNIYASVKKGKGVP